MPMYVGESGEPFEARYIMADNIEDIANWSHSDERFIRKNKGHYARIEDGELTITYKPYFERKFKEVG